VACSSGDGSKTLLLFTFKKSFVFSFFARVWLQSQQKDLKRHFYPNFPKYRHFFANSISKWVYKNAKFDADFAIACIGEHLNTFVTEKFSGLRTCALCSKRLKTKNCSLSVDHSSCRNFFEIFSTDSKSGDNSAFLLPLLNFENFSNAQEMA
jgi:hypothetical protein